VHELVGDAVEVVRDLDVVVDVDAAELPLSQLVAALGQRLECGSIQPLPQLSPADAELLEWSGIEILEQLMDRGIELGELEEASVA
jgi:hypothetical protein